MKKLSIALLLVSACALMIAQSTAQTEEISDLKKQVSSISSTNVKLGRNLHNLNKITKAADDNLQTEINRLETKLITISVSVDANDKKLFMAMAENNKNSLELKRMRMVVIVLFIISMIIIAVASFLINKKIKNTCGKIKSDLQKVIESAATDINNLSIKLAELDKKVQK